MIWASTRKLIKDKNSSFSFCSNNRHALDWLMGFAVDEMRSHLNNSCRNESPEGAKLTQPVADSIWLARGIRDMLPVEFKWK